MTLKATRSRSGRSARRRPRPSSPRAAGNRTSRQQEPRALDLYVAAFGFGLVSMSVIAIAAVGFTMQFGITNMINLAYGEVMISSAYAAYALNNAGVSIWAALVVGALFGAALMLTPALL